MTGEWVGGMRVKDGIKRGKNDDLGREREGVWEGRIDISICDRLHSADPE
jgi:hypothetical protein